MPASQSAGFVFIHLTQPETCMNGIQKIKKRNGNIVVFEEGKIFEVMKKAFAAKGVSITDDVLEQMKNRVVAQVLKSDDPSYIPDVERVQDVVEQTIMERGYFNVAKAYILYRFEHSKERTQHVIEKIEERALLVEKRDGRAEPFSLEKMKKSILHYTYGIENEVNVDDIVTQCRSEIYDGIKTVDVARAIIMVVRSMIERDHAYSILASRLLLSGIVKDIIGVGVIDYTKLDEQYRGAFVQSVKRAVELKKLDERLLSFDLQKMASALFPERDDLLRYIGTQTLNDRYFIRDTERNMSLETPQFMWMRIAMGLSIAERDKEDRAISFYTMMSTLRFIPSTPTLFHSGTPHPQLSSCYLNTVSDDLDHIFKVFGDNAQLSKWAGGVGTDWTNIRGTGSLIKTAGIHSQGVIPFLKIANDVTVAINRSGRRRGATCVYLETWHYDIEDFLELRKNTGDERRRTHDMNTANWIPDLFMKRVRDDEYWTLFSPDEVPDLHHIYGKKFDDAYVAYETKADRGEIALFRRVKARDLWKKILSMIFETGHPWVTFKDPSNIRSPQDHVGVVHNSNLCTEITLNTSPEETAVCNLGSVNFTRHIENGVFDEGKIKETIMIAMRMLDNVIDLNFYPTKEARASNEHHRPVGLGVMGFQDALYKLNISFASEAAVDFADYSMEVVSYYTILASSELARERGAYSTYKGSKWDRGLLPLDTIALLEEERGEKILVPRSARMDWAVVRESIKQCGMRNSNTMAIAPTATIANIAGSIPAIEPIYKNIYVKANISGDFTIVNPYLVEDLKNIRLWSADMLGKIKYHDGSIANIPEIPQHLKEKYKETFEIDMRWILKGAAHRGKWIDQSQSLNIFFNGSSGQELSELYMYAWELGLKTTYYLRTQAASQVEKSTVNTSEYGSTHTREGRKVSEKLLNSSVERGAVATTPLAPSSPLPSPIAAREFAHVAQASVSEENASTEVKEQQREAAPSSGPKLYVAKDAVCEACE